MTRFPVSRPAEGGYQRGGKAAGHGGKSFSSHRPYRHDAHAAVSPAAVEGGAVDRRALSIIADHMVALGRHPDSQLLYRDLHASLARKDVLLAEHRNCKDFFFQASALPMRFCAPLIALTFVCDAQKA